MTIGIIYLVIQQYASDVLIFHSTTRSVARVARQANVVSSKRAEISSHFLATGVNILHILQDEQDARRKKSITRHVDPFVGRRTLDCDIPPMHISLLARVKNHLEDSLNHNGVVDTVHAVHW